MGSKPSIKGQKVIEYLEKYPTLPTRTLARMVYENWGNLYKDLEDARAIVNYYRGTYGNAKRESLADNRFMLPEATETNTFSLPQPARYDWTNYHIPRELTRGVILGDIHIPYHDRKVLQVIMEHTQWFGADYIVLNGDIMDCYRLSKFLKDPSKAYMRDEVDTTRQFLTVLRVCFPDAHIVYKFGNHDDRMYNYLMDKAPELWDKDDSVMEVENRLGIPDLGIETVGEKRRIFAGKLAVLHGHEFWQSINRQVNPARGLFQKTFSSAVCSHLHQTSEHSEPNIKDELITTWSLGCCSQLHPEYMPINKWNHGFATMEKTPGGNFKLKNYRIIDGEMV